MLNPHADFHTFSGQPVFLEEPEKTQIVLEDILTGMSRIYRCNGQMNSSVLQHTDLCMQLVDQVPEALMGSVDQATLKRWMMVHDMAEVYTGDIPSSRKKKLWINQSMNWTTQQSLENDWLLPWKRIEQRWEEHVHAFLKIAMPATSEEKALVKMVDLWSLYCEFTQFNMVVLPLFLVEFRQYCVHAEELMKLPVLKVTTNPIVHLRLEYLIQTYWKEINFQPGLTG